MNTGSAHRVFLMRAGTVLGTLAFIAAVFLQASVNIRSNEDTAQLATSRAADMTTRSLRSLIDQTFGQVDQAIQLLAPQIALPVGPLAPPLPLNNRIGALIKTLDAATGVVILSPDGQILGRWGEDLDDPLSSDLYRIPRSHEKFEVEAVDQMARPGRVTLGRWVQSEITGAQAVVLVTLDLKRLLPTELSGQLGVDGRLGLLTPDGLTTVVLKPGRPLLVSGKPVTIAGATNAKTVSASGVLPAGPFAGIELGEEIAWRMPLRTADLDLFFSWTPAITV